MPPPRRPQHTSDCKKKIIIAIISESPIHLNSRQVKLSPSYFPWLLNSPLSSLSSTLTSESFLKLGFWRGHSEILRSSQLRLNKIQNFQYVLLGPPLTAYSHHLIELIQANPFNQANILPEHCLRFACSHMNAFYWYYWLILRAFLPYLLCNAFPLLHNHAQNSSA